MFRRWLIQAELSQWFDTLLIGYLYWVAFEWTILSRLGSYGLIQSIRNAIDMVPIVLFLALLVVQNLKLHKTDVKILGGFSLIILLSCLSLAIEKAPVSSVIGYIGVTVRFAPLIVLVRFTSEYFQEKLFRHIRIIYWIVAGIGVLSLVNKELFMKLFLPPADVFVNSLPTAYSDPGISGTFVHTVDFAFFIVALTTIYLVFSSSKKEKIMVILLSFTVCLFSHSLASVSALLFLLFLRSRRKWMVGLLLTILLIFFVWIFSDFLLTVLGMDIKYWIEISTEFNRLGYLTKVFPEFLQGGFKDVLLGMGYDAMVVDQKIMDYKNAPWVMVNNGNNLMSLKDVYWLSIIIVQGLIAFATTFYILGTVWIETKREDKRINSGIARTFILLTLFLGFFSMILDMKAFTFCFWLTAGLALNDSIPLAIKETA